MLASVESFLEYEQAIKQKESQAEFKRLKQEQREQLKIAKAMEKNKGNQNIFQNK